MNKLEVLQDRLKGLGKVAIAYSGGVDSNFLLAAAAGCLPPDCVLPILVSGAMMAQEEIREAKRRMEMFGTGGRVLEADVLQVPEFAENHPLRCYHCKKFLMNSIRKEASRLGFLHVLDGKNLDDGKAYRPGAKAAQELGILSPLYECGFTKQDIREFSRSLDLETWDKPANACLATRFPYGTHLTEEKLSRAAEAERALHHAGIPGGRVRIHGDIARLETDPEDFEKVLGNRELAAQIRECGFSFVTLDLDGYCSGSFDRTAGQREVPPDTGADAKEPAACGLAEEAGGNEQDEVTVLETNLDDCTGEWIGHVMELLLEAGARDVYCTPVFMKKNRPAYQLTVLADDVRVFKMEEILFRETTTIGIRRHREERTVLPRRQAETVTKYGRLKVKEVQIGEHIRSYPEYESARELAREHGVGLPELYRSPDEREMD